MVLPRAFALLRLLAEHSEGLNLSVIATNLEVPKSSLSSTLKALTDQGFLDRRGTLYFLGPEAYSLASTILARRSIRQIARPFMEKTLEETGETVLLAELEPDRKSCAYIDFVESDRSVRFAVAIGTRRPLYASAAGKVFLAFMSDAERAAYYDTVALEKRAERTITDRAVLEAELAQIRETGIAVTTAEYSNDAAGFAAPLRNSDGSIVGVLSIGAPVSRGERKREEYIGAARRAAAAISNVMGYSPTE
ncbi:MAG: IclR family transcriptional regulator [Pseudodonghicola sp.]